jgi:hypothetical protein
MGRSPFLVLGGASRTLGRTNCRTMKTVLPSSRRPDVFSFRCLSSGSGPPKEYDLDDRGDRSQCRNTYCRKALLRASAFIDLDQLLHLRDDLVSRAAQLGHFLVGDRRGTTNSVTLNCSFATAHV